MKKAQVFRFWKELRESTMIDAVIKKYKDRPGYWSERTLQRYAQADKGFRDGLSLEVLSKSTGWSKSHLGKVQALWVEWQTKQSVQARGIQASSCSPEEKAHQEQLRELAVRLSEQARLNLMQVVRTEQIGGAMARLDAALPLLPELKPDPDKDLGGTGD
jgi:hypothetical protein